MRRTDSKKCLKYALMFVCAFMMLGSVIYIGFYSYEALNHHDLDRRIDDVYSLISNSSNNNSPTAANNQHAPSMSSEPGTHAEAAFEPDFERFSPLLEINNDFVAMVIVPGTNIQLPVVKYSDNDKYLNIGFDGKRSARGTVFLDATNSSDFSDKNNVLYGHYMSDGTMFRDLSLYKNIDFYKNAPVVQIDSPYGMSTWLIFAAYTCEPTFEYFHTQLSGNRFESLLGEIQSRSLFNTNIEVTRDDKVLTLSTCDYSFENARFAVHARLLREGEAVPAEFFAEKNDNRKAYTIPDQQRLSAVEANNLAVAQHPLTRFTYYFQPGRDGIERYVGNFGNVQGPYTAYSGNINKEYYSWIAAGTASPPKDEFYLVSGGLADMPGLFLLRSGNVENPFRLRAQLPVTPEGLDAKWPVIYADESGNLKLMYVVVEGEREVLYSMSLDGEEPAMLHIAPIGTALRPVGIIEDDGLGILFFWKENKVLMVLTADGIAQVEFPETDGRLQIFYDYTSQDWKLLSEEGGKVSVNPFVFSVIPRNADNTADVITQPTQDIVQENPTPAPSAAEEIDAPTADIADAHEEPPVQFEQAVEEAFVTY